MALLVNLRLLEAHNLHLTGELSLAELDLDTGDEMIRPGHALTYDLEVQKLEEGLLVQGRLELDLACQCVRCLKAFDQHLELATWACHLPFEGEEAVRVVNDCVDLTPYLRDDILLEFPQHPLCEPECGGLPRASFGRAKQTSSSGQPPVGSPTWSELNKLKF